jgi:hypothetical protein
MENGELKMLCFGDGAFPSYHYPFIIFNSREARVVVSQWPVGLIRDKVCGS